MPTEQENIDRRAALRAQHGPAMDALSTAPEPLDEQARRELETMLADVPRRPVETPRAG